MRTIFGLGAVGFIAALVLGTGTAGGQMPKRAGSPPKGAMPLDLSPLTSAM